MREPFGRSAFDVVFNLFTSFGYFEDEAEHVRVLRNVAGALVPGGWFVLDYLNVADADRRLTPFEVRDAGAALYRIARWSDGRHFFKRIRVEDRTSGRDVEHVERVARFTLSDFARLFDAAGLRLCQVFGDYRLHPYDEAGSPRLILMGVRPGDVSAWPAGAARG